MIIIIPSDDVDGREVHASAPSSSGQVTALSGEAPDEGGLLQLHAENAGPGGGLPLPSRVLRRLALLLLLLSPLGRLVPARVAFDIRLLSLAGHFFPGGASCW